MERIETPYVKNVSTGECGPWKLVSGICPNGVYVEIWYEQKLVWIIEKSHSVVSAKDISFDILCYDDNNIGMMFSIDDENLGLLGSGYGVIKQSDGTFKKLSEDWFDGEGGCTEYEIDNGLLVRRILPMGPMGDRMNW